VDFSFSAEPQQRMIPPILAGTQKMCFAVTEPNTGLDITKLKTRAEKCDGGYKITGAKIGITNAHVADEIMLLVRTTPLDQVKRKTEGLSLFFTDLDRSKIEHRLIPKMGRHAVGSTMLFIEDLFVPEEDRIGVEGDGFKIILHGLNPERVLLSAGYAKERIVFDRPIGTNQGIHYSSPNAGHSLRRQT